MGQTGIRNGPATNQFNAFAAFLLGLPSSVGKAVAPELPLTTRAWRQGFYARDQWQATRDLTLTLGVRAGITVVRREEPRDRTLRRRDQQGACWRRGFRAQDVGGRNRPLRAAAWRRVSNRRQVGRSRRLRRQHRSVLLARLFRTNYPSLVAMDIVAANSFGLSAKRKMASRRFQIPALGNGIIDIPGNVIATPWGGIQPGIYTELQRDRAA